MKTFPFITTTLFTVFLSHAFMEYAAYGQTLTKEQINFLQKNAKVICKDSSITDADWKPLAAHLKGKKIILLGEFNHGSREIFQLRNSLIKYLHRELGIKTILFESGIGELLLADMRKNEMTPAQMTNGLFGGWRTEEFSDLMAYVKSENLSIAGFDVQRTGGSFAYLLKEIVGKRSIDSTKYSNLEERYGLAGRELTNRKAVYDSVKAKTEKLILDYQDLYNELLKKKSSDPSKDFQFALIILKNRVKYLGYMLAFVKDMDWNRRWATRDSAMAENIQWLRENIYGDGPVIIIAHNFHIARFNEKETVMGEILEPIYDKEMYSMGVFAGSGSFADNSGKAEQMSTPDTTALDIKHIIAALEGTVVFINMPQKREAGSEWLDNEIIINDTFIDLSESNRMKLSRHFDGLLLIKKVSPPAKK